MATLAAPIHSPSEPPSSAEGPPSIRDEATRAGGRPEPALPKNQTTDGRTGSTASKRKSGSALVASFPASAEERYDIIELIGAGGMGRVFKAKDKHLGRFVALKVIRDNEPALLQRFLKEVQTQARIEHEHVCKIYEFGEMGGGPYIAMQLIEGPTLKEVKDKLSLEEKLLVMCKVAEGLHAAHRIGMIHRDVKPSNIMLERKEDGSYHPYVMDFGLAREMTSGSGKTMTEAAVGTPSYMAPEQVTGEASKFDRRTDVYALGATLYELLVGRPPFVGPSGLEIMMQVAHDDPVQPRTINPSIPLDLQTIVLKCLEKEPPRRYDSAHALAEDLERYIGRTGPIKAKPASLVYLLSKKAKKHWPFVLVGGVVLVSGLLVLGLWIRAGVLAQRREALAEELGKTVMKIELFLRYAIALPAHDMAAEKQVIQDRMRFLKLTLASGDTNSAGPAHYALGRGHLALQEYEAAKDNLTLAIEVGYGRPEVHYALGLALGKMYEQALDRARRIEDKGAREAKQKEAEGSYRDPALSHLRQSEGMAVESKTYIEGLVALYEKRYEDAISKAEAAIQASPWLYEAKKLEGDARFFTSMLAKDGGRRDDARSELDKAIAAYRGAAEMARSDGGIHEALAEAWIQALELDIWQGRPHEAAASAAVAATEEALKANPKSANAFSKRGRAEYQVALRALYGGQDPRETLKRVIESEQQALRLSPGDAIAWDFIGNSQMYVAQYERKIGLDPTSSFNESIKSLDEAIRVQPTLAWAWNDAGVVLGFRAEYENERGMDPRPSVDLAVKRFERAAELDPAYVFPPSNISWVLALAADNDITFGRDPRPDTKRGIDAGTRAERMDPKWCMAYNNKALHYVYLAQYEDATGGDPQPALDEADTALQASLGVKSDLGDTHFQIGMSKHARAVALVHKGADPTRALEEGRASLRRAIELDEATPAIRVELARLELTEASYAAGKGESPGPYLAAAKTALEPTLRSFPRHAPTLAAMADVYAMRAKHATTLRLKAMAEVDAGLAAADKALENFPHMPLALASKGALFLLRARETSGAARMGHVDDAVKLLNEALSKNPLLQQRIKALLEEARQLGKK